MFHVQSAAIEHLSHELSLPAAWDVEMGGVEARLRDIQAGARRLTEAVDEVLAKFWPTDDLDDGTREANLKLIDGIAARMSLGLKLFAAEIAAKDADRVGPPSVIIVAMWDSHDAWVRDYFRLIALRAELDPDTRATGPALTSAADIDAWAASLLEG